MANLLYNLAPPFSDTKQYDKGAIVVNKDRIYEVTASEYTVGSFDPEQFKERYLYEFIGNSNLLKMPDMELRTHYSSDKAKYVGEMLYTGEALSKYKKCTFTLNLNVEGGCIVDIKDDTNPNGARLINTATGGNYSVDLNNCIYLYFVVSSVSNINSISNIKFS